MKVVFQDPLKGKPYNSAIIVPKVPGVYVYGLLLPVKNELGKLEEKFVPHAVGETNDLNNRLINQKYSWLQTGGVGTKELFDFSSSIETISSIYHRYDDMKYFDSQCKKKGKLGKIRGLSSLVYFQDSAFYNFLLGVSKFVGNFNQIQAINNLLSLGTPSATSLANAISLTKMKFLNNFYFIYATDYITNDEQLLFSSKRKNPIRLQVEADTKFALKSVQIHTTEPHHKEPNFTTEINLNVISGSLVNFLDTDFPDPLILYPSNINLPSSFCYSYPAFRG